MDLALYEVLVALVAACLPLLSFAFFFWTREAFSRAA